MTCLGSFYSNSIKRRSVPRDTRTGLNSVVRNPSTPTHTCAMLFEAMTRKRSNTHVTLDGHTEWTSWREKGINLHRRHSSNWWYFKSNSAAAREWEKNSRASCFIPQTSSQRSTEKLKKVTCSNLNKLQFFPDTCSAIILKSRSVRRGQFHASP